MKKICAPLVALLLLFGGCTFPGAQADRNVLRIDGSSTLYPLTEAVVEEFGREHGTLRVTIGISGTGGGFQKLLRGATDISDASRAMNRSELQQAREKGVEFIELPVAYDGIVVVVHPENNWCQALTLKEIRRLWETEAQGRIVRWNQIRSGWPDQPIHLYGPGVDSGTYDYFTRALIGIEGGSRGDFISSEDDNVLVMGVIGDRLSLGFFGYTYYRENRNLLKAVAIENRSGQIQVLPSSETIAGGLYEPLSRPVYIYVRGDALVDPEVSRFVEYYLNVVPELVRDLGYIPLSQRAYALVLERFRKRTTGSAFGGGARVGVDVEEVLDSSFSSSGEEEP